jgi:hypothetical protein
MTHWSRCPKCKKHLTRCKCATEDEVRVDAMVSGRQCDCCTNTELVATVDPGEEYQRIVCQVCAADLEEKGNLVEYH